MIGFAICALLFTAMSGLAALGVRRSGLKSDPPWSEERMRGAREAHRGFFAFGLITTAMAAIAVAVAHLFE